MQDTAIVRTRAVLAGDLTSQSRHRSAFGRSERRGAAVVGIGEQKFNDPWIADRLSSAVAGHTLGLTVPQCYLMVAVECRDQNRHVLQHDQQPLLILPQYRFRMGGLADPADKAVEQERGHQDEGQTLERVDEDNGRHIAEHPLQQPVGHQYPETGESRIGHGDRHRAVAGPSRDVYRRDGHTTVWNLISRGLSHTPYVGQRDQTFVITLLSL